MSISASESPREWPVGRRPGLDDGRPCVPMQPVRTTPRGNVPRSNQIRSPENRWATGSQGNRMRTSQRDGEAGRRDAGPWTGVGAGQGGDLERALRPDDDLREGERVVREGPEQLRVERARAVVALPALTGRDDLVDAVGRERRDEPVDVAGVLGDRVADPQALDPAQFRRVERTSQTRSGWTTGSLIRRAGRATRASGRPRPRCCSGRGPGAGRRRRRPCRAAR